MAEYKQKNYKKEYYKNNSEKLKGYAKKFRDNNPNYHKNYQKKNREQATKNERKSILKRIYKITEDEYNEFLKLQDNKCAICKDDFDLKNGKGIHTDHCHDTDKVRGILCGKCNKGLGLFRDNIKYLQNAIQYLEINHNKIL